MSVEALIRQHLSAQPTATLDELAALASVSRPTLHRLLAKLVAQGQLVRLRRGLYQCSAQHDASDSWVQVMQAYSQGVLCLLSALAFHVLTTQSPGEVWLALPKSAWRKQLEYPPVRLLHFSPESWAVGVETHQREGGTVRVYSVAKTVADCFKFRHQIGLDVAIEALREGWQQRRFTLEQLAGMAKVCRVQAVMRPYVEALTAS